jgi:hypothetical protein
MVTKEPDHKDANKQVTMMKTVGFAMEFGFIIALPLIAFLFLGKYFDNKYQKEYFSLIGILLALTLSTTWLYRKIRNILNDLKKK